MKGTKTVKILARKIYFVRGLLALSIFLLGARGSFAQGLTPAWVELGEEGKAYARIIVNTPQDCPAIQIDVATTEYAGWVAARM
jgi:hypothetical protein